MNSTADPNWTDIVIALTSAATLLVVVVGAFFAKKQLDDLIARRLASHWALLAERAKQWDELSPQRKAVAEYVDPAALEEYVRHLYESNAPEYYELIKIPNFFEGLGMEVAEGLLPAELLWKLFGDEIIFQWIRWEGVAAFLRRGQPFVYEYFERLARQSTGETT